MTRLLITKGRYILFGALCILLALQLRTGFSVAEDAARHLATGVEKAIESEEHNTAEGNTGAVEAEHQKSGGLPQLNPVSFPSQIFWLAVTFFVMYTIFSRRILPEISSVIENRHDHVQSDLGEAEKLKDKAEKVHRAYEEILEEARNKASGLFSQSEEEVKKISAVELYSFRERSTKQIQDAEHRIAGAIKAAILDMDEIAAEVASQAAEKIVGITTDINQAKSVIANINKKAA